MTTSPPPFDVCVVGSVNLDLVATVERLPRPGETVPGSTYAEYDGGKGLNQAVAAARSGARVAMVGMVGDDDAGRRLLATMTDESIDTTMVGTSELPTGRALIGVSAHGENSIIVVGGANLAVTADSLPAAKVLLTQLEVPIATVESVARRARAAGTITVLNPAPAQSLPHSLLEVFDIVVPNEHEIELLGGVDHLLALGVTTVVVTRGAAGAEVHQRTGRWHVEPFAVRPVDTTGAGDTFCGTLCARLASGDTLEQALRYAAVAAALSTTRNGAVPSIPDAAEVAAALHG